MTLYKNQHSSFQEMRKLNSLLDRYGDFLEVEQLAEVRFKGHRFPIFGITLGCKDKTAPTLGLFGGVHGLEKVGSHLTINHIKYICEMSRWDSCTQELLERSRIVAIPIVNPGGMFLNQRSNPQGIDIMRNAPVDAEESTLPLVSGHRIGPWLPWYRGIENEDMETETQALSDFVEKELFQSRVALSLDIHSGFGAVDRLWYPYSKTSEDFPHIIEATKLKSIIDQSLLYHIYQIEPQSESYLINGDAWDYLFDRHFNTHGTEKIFIPWTLELGSWIWVRKNPRQLLNSRGLFNPILPHRYERIMRRHRGLLEIFHKLVANHENWLENRPSTAHKQRSKAIVDETSPLLNK